MEDQLDEVCAESEEVLWSRGQRWWRPSFLLGLRPQRPNRVYMVRWNDPSNVLGARQL
jgi:hypothetical protein